MSIARENITINLPDTGRKEFRTPEKIADSDCKEFIKRELNYKLIL
jgi:hypothetical protein